VPNALLHETSPYLQQHARNPVDWMPYGDAAFDLARQRNCLMVISIGYSACHWCHVMEHESFEDLDVAGLMNARFVSVKVDCEERPDVDQLYMEALHLMRGNGGWPLNAICLPDGRPIYCGTYFPKANWLHILTQLADLYEHEPDRARQFADNLVEGLQAVEAQQTPNGTSAHPPLAYDPHAQFASMADRLDMQDGGFSPAPKFPEPSIYRWLLHYTTWCTPQNDPTQRSRHADRALHLTLERMAYGGIYDVVGGGWSRYSVDSLWHVPHFEKMLYDNAQLVSLYCAAYRRQPHPLYGQVVAQTLEFIARELTDPETGAFYSALDADSDGVEGKFYVWTHAEIEALLGPTTESLDAALFCGAYSVRPEGNWEHGQNVLIRYADTARLAEAFVLPEADVEPRLQALCAKLLQYRAGRIRPGLDNKHLTAWNGLMIRALADAHRTLGNPAYLAAARRAMQFVDTVLTDGHRLMRTAQGTRAHINGYLDDYAFVIDALLALYQTTLEPHYLHRAHSRMQYVIEHFYDPTSGYFYYTSDLDPPLLVRKRPLHDNVVPSANAQMAHNLLTLSQYYHHADWARMAQGMLHGVLPMLSKHGKHFCCWGQLALRLQARQAEVVVVGPDAPALLADLGRQYLPQVVVAGPAAAEATFPPLAEGKPARTLPDGSLQTLIYVCHDRTCQRPVATVADALALI